MIEDLSNLLHTEMKIEKQKRILSSVSSCAIVILYEYSPQSKPRHEVGGYKQSRSILEAVIQNEVHQEL